MSAPPNEGAPSAAPASGVRRNVLYYAIANNWIVVTSTLVGLLVRRVIPPEVFGAYFLAMTFSGYITLVNTPLNTSVDVQVPLFMGRGESKKAAQFTGELYALLMWLLVAQAAVLLAMGLFGNESSLSSLAFMLAALILFFDGIFSADRLLLKAHNRFKPLLNASLASGVIYAGAVVLPSLTWGDKGFLIGVTLASACRFVLFRTLAFRQLQASWSLRPSFHHTGRLLLGAGVIIGLYRFTQFGMQTVDRFFVERAMGLESLGVYSMAVSLAAIVHAIPVAMWGGALPAYLRVCAKGGDRTADATIRFHKSMVWVTAIIALGAVVTAEFTIRLLFPLYLSAARPAQIMFLSMVILQAGAAPSSFLMGSPSQRPLLTASAAGMLVAVIAEFIFIQFWGVIGVAFAALGAYAISYTVLVWAMQRDLRRTMSRDTFLAVSVVAIAIALQWSLSVWWALAYAVCAGAGCVVLFIRAAGLAPIFERYVSTMIRVAQHRPV